MEITFKVSEETKNIFEDVVNKINEKYPEDEPFDKDAWAEAKMKEFVKEQRELMGMDNYIKMN